MRENYVRNLISAPNFVRIPNIVEIWILIPDLWRFCWLYLRNRPKRVLDFDHVSVWEETWAEMWFLLKFHLTRNVCRNLPTAYVSSYRPLILEFGPPPSVVSAARRQTSLFDLFFPISMLYSLFMSLTSFGMELFTILRTRKQSTNLCTSTSRRLLLSIFLHM